MATIAKLTSDQLSAARKAGFKRKKPKKPKASATLTVMENWVTRNNDWVKDAKSKVASVKKKEGKKDSDAKKREALKRQISGA